MSSIQIITDSTADLPQGMASALGIDVIPLYVTLDNVTYADGVDLTPAELFPMVEQGSDIPKTAAPYTGDFTDHFSRALDAGKDVVFIGLSSKLSGTVQSAHIAARILDERRIHIVDSMSLSTGTGILAMEGALMAAQDVTAAQVASRLIYLRERYRASMLMDTMAYLHKGGRCSTLKLYGANLLGIKPEVALKDGLLVPAKLFRGSSAKAVRSYLRYRFENLDHIDPAHVVVSMSAQQKDGIREMVMDYIRSLHFFKNIYEVTAGCVISAHVGPGAVGILTRS